MADPPFHCFTTEGRGRGLAASRTINPGEEILREEPTALVLFQNGSKTATGAAASEECHELLAQLLVASEHPELREDCARLVSSVDMFRARDPVLIEQVSQLATPRVRELLKARGEHQLLDTLGPQRVVEAFCKHLLNGMAITCDESLQSLGMALFTRHGALLNHDDLPNCWTCFQRVNGTTSLGGQRGSSAACYVLVLRSFVQIRQGEELTIAYVDTAVPRATLHATLRQRYLFEPSSEPGQWVSIQLSPNPATMGSFELVACQGAAIARHA